MDGDYCLSVLHRLLLESTRVVFLFAHRQCSCDSTYVTFLTCTRELVCIGSKIGRQSAFVSEKRIGRVANRICKWAINYLFLVMT